MASHRQTRSEVAAVENMMESIRAMARAVRGKLRPPLSCPSRWPSNGNRSGNKHGNEHGEEYLKFAEFCKANPPSFRGTYNPDAIDKWVKEVEKIFSILTYTKKQKVSLAAFMLKLDTEFRWNNIKNLMESDETQINWEVFKMAFYKKYFLLPLKMPRNQNSCS